MQKFLLAASLAGLLLTGPSVRAHGISMRSSSQQGQQRPEVATKTVSGKITAIGSDGTSFTLQVSGNGSDTNNNTMQFVLDSHAKVQGTVKVGTTVTVEYALNGAQNTAVAVTAQG